MKENGHRSLNPGQWILALLVAYLLKQLDSVAPGRSLCIKALAITALLMQEADKLTLDTAFNYNLNGPEWAPLAIQPEDDPV